MQCPGCGIQLYDSLNQCPNCGFVLRPNYNPNLQNQYIQNQYAQNQYMQKQYMQNQYAQNQYAQNPNIPYYAQAPMNGYNGQPFMNGMGVPSPMNKNEFEQIPNVKKWCKDIKIAAIVLYVLFGINFGLLFVSFVAGGVYSLLFVLLELLLMIGLTIGAHVARNFPCAVTLVVLVCLHIIFQALLYEKLAGWYFIIGAISLLHPTYQYMVMKGDFKRKGWLK